MQKLFQAFTLICLLSSYTINAQTADQSVLSSGDLYKVPISETGIYSIDKNYLESLDINTDQIKVSDVHVYSNRGGMLPQSNAIFRTDDLNEMPVKVIDTDNSWDTGDKIIFYAEGPKIVSLSRSDSTYDFRNNIYDNENYVFIKINNQPTKNITTTPYDMVPDVNFSNTYETVLRYEEDVLNVLALGDLEHGSGKEWYGESIQGSTVVDLTGQFDFTNTDFTKPVDVKASIAARSSASTTYQLNIGDTNYAKTIGSVVVDQSNFAYARKKIISEQTYLDNTPSSVNISFKGSTNALSWVDYVQLTVNKKITAGEPIILRHRKSLGKETSGYENIGFDNVWDITDINHIKAIEINDGRIIYQPEGLLHQFIAFNDDHAKTLEGGEKLENQNVHQIERADLVIIYPNGMGSQAQKLADHRRNHNGYEVATVLIDHIYNEYASGRVDPTAIRDFARGLYRKDPDFKYLLLLGDASYDVRNLRNNSIDYSVIPTMQTDISLHPVKSFPYDDYYGLLDDQEGEDLLGEVDIAIGRIPVINGEQADAVIEKLINYDNHQITNGEWKNNIVFTADDEDGNAHIQDADEIAQDVYLNNKLYNQKKVYFDAFPQQNTPGGDRYYEASEEINRYANEGMLVISYLGHGGPISWGQERVLKKADVDSWNNADRLPLMITATCTFGGYDDPDILSLGEYTLLKPDGGVAALLTTVRAVYIDSNRKLTQATYNNIFEKHADGGSTFGDIMVKGKNEREAIAGSSETENIRKYTLLGDPSQQLSIPEYNVNTTEINGLSTSQVIDTLGALDIVNVKGEINNLNDEVAVDFNGELFITVFDKASTVQTLQNDPKSKEYNFELLKNVIYKGTTTVTGGKFEYQFTIPKDINYKVGKGKISYYAYNGVQTEASGYYDDIVIGGTGNSEIQDDEGPEITLYINDESFQNGGTTGPNPKLLVDLKDDIGINITGTSIGHDISAKLSNQRIDILNDSYQVNQEDNSLGRASQQYYDLPPGEYSIEVEAWDIANNVSRSKVDFLVVDDKILDISAYPNPATKDITISGINDIANGNATLEVYDAMGRFILEEKASISLGEYQFVLNMDNNARQFGKGVYFYKIILESDQLDTPRRSATMKFIRL